MMYSGTNSPSETLDSNIIKNAASSTGKQAYFTALLLQAKSIFLKYEYWFNAAKFVPLEG